MKKVIIIFLYIVCPTALGVCYVWHEGVTFESVLISLFLFLTSVLAIMAKDDLFRGGGGDIEGRV